mgnify:FL=1|jgi:hypothetical protein
MTTIYLLGLAYILNVKAKTVAAGEIWQDDSWLPAA